MFQLCRFDYSYDSIVKHQEMSELLGIFNPAVNATGAAGLLKMCNFRTCRSRNTAHL